jgi:hypothetical protein
VKRGGELVPLRARRARPLEDRNKRGGCLAAERAGGREEEVHVLHGRHVEMSGVVRELVRLGRKEGGTRADENGEAEEKQEQPVVVEEDPVPQMVHNLEWVRAGMQGEEPGRREQLRGNVRLDERAAEERVVVEQEQVKKTKRHLEGGELVVGKRVRQILRHHDIEALQ